jgi:uridine nucleosidase
VLVFPGAAKPLIRPAKADPEIHGIDVGPLAVSWVFLQVKFNTRCALQGLGGVEGLPSPDSDEVQARLNPNDEPRRALVGMADAISKTWRSGKGSKVTIISTGPMTNVSNFLVRSIYQMQNDS